MANEYAGIATPVQMPVTGAPQVAAPKKMPADEYADVATPLGPAPERQASVAHELATQPAYGFNEGLDALYNLPNAAVNVGAHIANIGANAVRQATGHEPVEYKAPIGYARLASRFNEPDPWQNIANRAAEGLGYNQPFPNAAPETGGEQPTTTAGRFGRAIGQQAGASVLPTAGMVARGVIPATGRAMAQTAASAVGAGTAGEVAKEAGAGPIGQTIAQVAGGFAGPPLLNITKKAADVAGATGSYGRRVWEEAQNPELGGARDILNAAKKAGLDLNEMRDAVMPDFPRGSNLRSRGFTRDNLRDIVTRSLDGEEPASIAGDYAHLKDSQGRSVTADTISNYLERFYEKNPTPMNFMDLAAEQAGPGGVQPVTRLARSKQIVSGEAEPAQRLYERQAEQPGRITNYLNGASYERRLASAKTRLKVESDKAYGEFHQEPMLATKKLDDLLEDPVFRNATETAMWQARSSAIRQNQADLRAGRPPSQAVLQPGAPSEGYTPEQLDLIQRQLRLSSQTVNNPNTAAHARDLRQTFLDRIEDYYPTFRKIRQNYAEGIEGINAMEAGEKMTARLGPGARDALNDYRALSPANKELFRLGFERKLTDLAANPKEGTGVAAQFTSPAFREIVTELYGEKNAGRLINFFNREAITTNVKNAIFGNSNTAQTAFDIDEAMSAAKAAAALGRGNVTGFLERAGESLAQQIGAKRATYVVRRLTETNPADMLATLDRLIEMAPSVAERNALRVWRDWGPWGPGRGWMAGETATAATDQNQEKPPAGFPHARRAGDKEWYIPDPSRPGKYLHVRPAPGSSKGALQVIGQTQ